MKRIFVPTCCAVLLAWCPMAWAAFQLIPPATDTDACVYQLTSNTARVVFPGWRSDGVISTSNYAVIAMKHVAAVDSVKSANAIVTGFPSNLFSFVLQPSCSAEFTALFGSTATAFSDNPNNNVPALTPASLEFVVKLKPGKTITDLVNDLATGNPLIFGEPAPAGGSPVAGSGRSVSGSLVSGSSSAVLCLQPGAVIEGCDVVTQCSIPSLSTWGYAVALGLMLVLGTLMLRRRRPARHLSDD